MLKEGRGGGEIILCAKYLVQMFETENSLAEIPVGGVLTGDVVKCCGVDNFFILA